MSKEDRKGERRMKKALVLLVVAIIVCQGFAVLAPTARAQAPPESAPEVVCVPFHGTLLGVPHDAWIGNKIILKGTAHDPDGDSTLEAYKWDFGDGYSTDWIAGVNPYIIEAKHTYTGTMADGTPYGVGKYFTAWLHVKDADGLVGQDSYFIVIRDKTLDVEVNVAIDDGLWWLHKQAYRYTSGGIDYARWSSYYSYYTSATAESVLAFEIQGHQPIGNPHENPYVETVQRGLNYVFSKTRVVDISAWGPGTSSPYGDPDTNGNDIGIGVINNREPYELGMVMMAIAASGDPDLTANTGPTGVVGRTYKDILTDMVDICAWGQNDYGGARGGWRYAWNYGSSDNSVSQWPIMALEAAETNWGIVVADFVKTELDTYWLTYSQNVDGSFGYSGPWGPNIARTGTGIIGLNYVGLLADNPRIANAVSWLGNHWSEFGNYYGMYAVMKGMRTANPEITTVGTHDWYAEYAQYLVNNQQADDGWPNYYGRVLATDWAILIMTPTVTQPRPVADAGPDVDSFPPTIPLEFDASGSYHMDPTKSIVLYEWDFETDGIWDYSGTDLQVEHAYPAYYVLVELVKAVIDSNYLWGGKGWDLNEKRFVEPEEIKEGYNYWNPKEEKVDFGKGLDCSGLAFWSYNKMANTANYEDSLLPEGAQGQWEACNKIGKDDLRLGDLLFFDEYQIGDGVMDHVAMYVGSFKYDGEKYNVVHASGFTSTITPAHYNPENEMLTTVKATGEKQTIGGDGYGRVTEAPAPDNVIDWDKTAKDYSATLRVTDNSDPPFQDTDTCVIHITAPPWKPVADPDGPYEGYEGVPIQLDGSRSYDPESRMYAEGHPWYETIVTYEWDLDNDGQFDDSTDVKPSHQWDTKGTYSVGLKVTDSQPSGPGGTIGPLDVDIRYTTVVVLKPVRRFNPSIDGFGFDNYGLEPGCPAYTLKQIYDKYRVLLPTLDPEVALLVALYAHYTFYVHSIGHCYGISQASVHYYYHPEDLPSGYSCANDVKTRDESSAVNLRVETSHHNQIFDVDSLLKAIGYDIGLFAGLDVLKSEINSIIGMLDQIKPVVVRMKAPEGWHMVVAYDYGGDDTETLVDFYDTNGHITGHDRTMKFRKDAQGKYYIFDDGDTDYNWEKVVSTYGPISWTWDTIKENIGKLIDWLKDKLSDLWDAMIQLANEAAELWSQFVSWLANQARNAWVKLIRIKLFSHAQLHVYNSEGLHVGPTLTGELDQEFDAMFLVTDEMQYCALPIPEAGDYIVELIGVSTGTYTLSIGSIDQGVVIEEKVNKNEICEGMIHKYWLQWTSTGDLIIDNTPPLITVHTPSEGMALQDGVTLQVSAWDLSTVASMTFSIKCAQGNIISPEFESMPANPINNGKWELHFDTTQLPDGFYLFVANGTDVLGNWGTAVVQFSICNWACLELLPASESNKAGRMMPVKFSLRVVEAVDPAQPFVYNEELTIVIYEEGDPDEILQTSTYGDTARDYRIDSEDEHYITNFRTIGKKPKTYVVEIYRKGMLIGSFTFETVK